MKMSTYMNHELIFFFYAMGTGVSLLLIYDLIRIFRRLIPHKGMTISVIDFFYWIFAGFYLFAMIYCKNDGIIRGYAILGVFAGMYFYHCTISRYLVNFGVKILGFPVKIVKNLLKRLIFVTRRCKIRAYLKKLGSFLKKGLRSSEKGNSCEESKEK